MRTISAAAVTDAVAKLCIQANTHLPPDIVSALDRTRREEPWPLAKETLGPVGQSGACGAGRTACLSGHGDGLCVCGAGPGGPHPGRL